MSDDVKDLPLDDELLESAEEGEATSLSSDLDEVDVLRSELSQLQTELEAAKSLADENKNKWLRSRAELDNYRRRAAQDVERAREAGLDSALLPVMAVYDDLGRALKAVDEADPSKIVPGVQAVRDSLERNLDNLGIVRVGAVGDKFDPDVHEALTALPTDNPEQAGRIADVFEVGFMRGERLVRPARVVVYQ